MINFEKISDKITFGLGSTGSAILHTVIFLVFTFMWLAGDERDKDAVLLILTTLVSLEAILLAIFIQRSTNKQSEKLERVLREIRYNTVAHLDQPLDVVVQEIKDKVDQTHKKVNATHQKVTLATDALNFSDPLSAKN